MDHYFDNIIIQSPGEHKLVLQGIAGELEGIFVTPKNICKEYFAIIGHPHSLHGGTMQNKVVTTMAKTFSEFGIPNIRFNFRGVGLSQGKFDAGIGESEDMLYIAQKYLAIHPETNLIFAGFSFGSFVSYLASIHPNTKLLISVAPAVTHFDYTKIMPATKNWVIVQGDKDEVIPYDEVHDFAIQNGLDFIKFPNTGHFFHGQLSNLQEKLSGIIRNKLHLC